MSKNSSKKRLIQALHFDQYFSATTWSDYNRSFFDQLAPKYDWLNAIITLGQQRFYKKKVVLSARADEKARILDLCTGSGDLALLAAKQYPGAAITAVDASVAMLEMARRKCRKFPRISFQMADALNLPYDDENFDVVFVGFGLRNFEDLSQGLKEIRRVLKPGGVFVNLDLSRPERGIKRFLHKIYFEHFMPWMGKHVVHRHEFNSLAYLPLSNKEFPPAGELAKLIAGSGFGDIRHYEYMLGGVSHHVAVKPLSKSPKENLRRVEGDNRARRVLEDIFDLRPQE